MLIPARYLVNDMTVVQEAAARITYWHVECAQHDVLLAEGLAAESYLDTGNRDAFVEAGVVSLQPDLAIDARAMWEQFACRPWWKRARRSRPRGRNWQRVPKRWASRRHRSGASISIVWV